MAIKFLTGAPERSSLSWTREELLNDFLPSFSKYIRGASKEAVSSSDAWSGSWPSWRTVTSIHVHNDGPITALEVDRNKSPPHGDTGIAGAEGSESPITDEGGEELESSFVVHEFFEPSQVVSITQYNNDLSILDDDNFASFANFEDTSYSILSHADDSILEKQSLPTDEYLTNLSALPNANYLRRILPGTMTINIIGGIVDISPPRAVTVRRLGGSYDMNIVDLYVRDDTEAGLKITIWLKPELCANIRSLKHQEVGLHLIISRLRRGDIVFLKHIALRSYRGEVCGQSLSSERYPNNGTKIALLCRGEGARDKLENLSRTHAIKLAKVQAWVTQFLGPRTGARIDCEGGESRKVLGKRKLRYEELPEDTLREFPADTEDELEG